MASEKFEIEPEEVYRGESRGCMGGCLKGCFILLLILVALIAVLMFFVSQNWRGWGADLAEWVSGEMIAEINLPDQEKREIRLELARPIEAMRDGSLTHQQLGQLMETLSQSPLMPLFAVSMVDSQYFDRSGLTLEEKEQGRLAMQRFVRGVIDKDIQEPAIEKVISHIADREGGDHWRFREKVTDEELRAMIATAEQEADAAGVPAQVEAVDPSDEIRKIIDAVMGPAEEHAVALPQ